MPGPTNTLLIEGSVEELADELAQYIDNLRKAQNAEGGPIQPEVVTLMQEKKTEDALKLMMNSASVLNYAPEKEIISAYNLLIYLIRQAPKPEIFLRKLCQNLSKPFPSSPQNGAGLALAVLSTVFNTVAPDSELRYRIFMAILQVIKSSLNFETLRPQLKNIDTWMEEWDIDEDQKREIFLELDEVAQKSGESEAGYEYLIRALRTFSADEASNEKAREHSLRALNAALTHPTHFDFQDLTSLDTIQALRKSDPIHFELLELFTSEMLEDFNDFKDEHEGWIEEQDLDADALNRKMRLLTLTTLSAQAAQTRSLPYAQIAKALGVPLEEVELWVIDVIRAGLVEGKLSQLNQEFLIHRSTYRVFGENQWREVAARLNMWRSSLEGVLQVVRQEKESFMAERAQEAREMENKLNSGGYRGRGNAQPRAVEVDAD